MHPAFSVIAFTTLSGAGYGLLAWAALATLLGAARVGPLLAATVLALVLVTIGLLSSLAHLGRPGRAWRAMSQWRTSWLSREGVAALATYLPALALLLALGTAWLDPTGHGVGHVPGAWTAVAAPVAIALALATVACTAMIYASLPPIPAWRHRLVVPVYLLAALASGGLLLLALLAPSRPALAAGAAPAAMGLCALLGALKLRYWREIDATPLPATRGDAVGLPGRGVAVFERPSTEASYVTREMVFVVARVHAQRLRTFALAFIAVLPIALLLPVWQWGWTPWPWCAAAALSCLLGLFLERWLFFAQARHVVSLYY